MRKVRFRTLGCWPLTAAVEFDADTIRSRRRGNVAARRYPSAQGRLIDHDQAGAMEKKKQEGYF